MFGKFFASTFTGSMFGAGTDVFAVWAYVIANTIDSTIELNPSLIAAVLGTTTDRIIQAVDVLCQPDDKSRSPEHGGCRLIREGQYQYQVVNHQRYRAVLNEEDRRAYNRQKQQEYRSKISKSNELSLTNTKSNDLSLTVNDKNSLLPLSAHTEAEAEAIKKISRSSTKRKASADADFVRFQALYPVSRQIGGENGRRAFKKALAGNEHPDVHLATMLASLEQHKRSEQWQNPRLIPLMTTWLNQERWTQILPELPQTQNSWCKHTPQCRGEQAHRKKLSIEHGESAVGTFLHRKRPGTL